MNIKTEDQLDTILSKPRNSLVDMMKTLDGDILILGIAGKMGLTLGRMAKTACELAGVKKRIIGVSRFSESGSEEKLRQWGLDTIRCDLIDQNAVNALPDAKNIIFMAGRKFGTDGTEELTWAMNVTVPGYVGMKFRAGRIVVFSTGCVYPLVAADTKGCEENITPAPVGEYAQSCLGRERIFGHFCKTNKNPTLLLRLNYAVDLRYGVLFDIASKIWSGEPVTRSVPWFNCLWQGDANNYALLSLQHCSIPAVPLNITGQEIISVEWAAEKFGELMNKKVKYKDTPGKTAYLNNSKKAFTLFGKPEITLDQMIEWQADWIMAGGRALGKPTHFEVNNGKF